MLNSEKNLYLTIPGNTIQYEGLYFVNISI